MGHRTSLLILNFLFALAAATAAPGCSGADASEPTMTDEEIEHFLLKGKVVDSKEVGTGITKPWKVTLELDGKTLRALFKDVDVYKPGMTKFPGGKSEMNFSDKYIYERAAYLLDRQLGMDMVPVAVNRQWSGKSGAMVEWIENGIAEHERLEQGLETDDPVLTDHQAAIMRLFDALIYNVDRNQSNMLYTRDDWNLHLIDHSRSFRRDKKLPEAFKSKPASLPRALFEIVDPDDLDRPVAYGERGRVLLTTLTREFFMPRFAERDEGGRAEPCDAFPWDGVRDLGLLTSLQASVAVGVY